jgi:hypothetical protein
MGQHLHSAPKGSIQFFKRKFTVPEVVNMHIAVMAFSLLYIILVWDSAPPNCILYPTIPPFSCISLHLIKKRMAAPVITNINCRLGAYEWNYIHPIRCIQQSSKSRLITNGFSRKIPFSSYFPRARQVIVWIMNETLRQ